MTRCSFLRLQFFRSMYHFAKRVGRNFLWGNRFHHQRFFNACAFKNAFFFSKKCVHGRDPSQEKNSDSDKKESLHHHEEFVKGVRHFYFDSKALVQADSIDARERLTNMISDRPFIFPTRKIALIHRSLNKDPTNKIYLYKFPYTSDYSYCNGFDVRATYGASHADELQYLMNQRIFCSKIGPGSPADEMIEKMVRLWANFARTGVPSYPGQINEWVPVPLKHEVQDDTLEYFNIDKQDSMVIEPFTERMNFWDHVPNLSLSF